jgi:hypothetical protein
MLYLGPRRTLQELQYRPITVIKLQVGHEWETSNTATHPLHWLPQTPPEGSKRPRLEAAHSPHLMQSLRIYWEITPLPHTPSKAKDVPNPRHVNRALCCDVKGCIGSSGEQPVVVGIDWSVCGNQNALVAFPWMCVWAELRTITFDSRYYFHLRFYWRLYGRPYGR